MSVFLLLCLQVLSKASGLSPSIINLFLFPQMFIIFVFFVLFSQSALEGKLSKLWRHLLAMRQNLSFLLAPGQVSSETAHQILPTVVYARLINQVVQCHQAVEECCSDLLTLTLLVPSAPWVSVRCGILKSGTLNTAQNTAEILKKLLESGFSVIIFSSVI